MGRDRTIVTDKRPTTLYGKSGQAALIHRSGDVVRQPAVAVRSLLIDVAAQAQIALIAVYHGQVSAPAAGDEHGTLHNEIIDILQRPLIHGAKPQQGIQPKLVAHQPPLFGDAVFHHLIGKDAQFPQIRRTQAPVCLSLYCCRQRPGKNQ